ncbi:MAG: hypothetical protein EXR70_21970 [Deltaproteobacteria bacterium]|nr:hypothetical protein [Deltaproteobacteria bacterium]
MAHVGEEIGFRLVRDLGPLARHFKFSLAQFRLRQVAPLERLAFGQLVDAPFDLGGHVAKVLGERADIVFP